VETVSAGLTLSIDNSNRYTSAESPPTVKSTQDELDEAAKPKEEAPSDDDNAAEPKKKAALDDDEDATPRRKKAAPVEDEEEDSTPRKKTKAKEDANL